MQLPGVRKVCDRGKEVKAVLSLIALFTVLCGVHFLWRFGGGGWYSVYTTRQEEIVSVGEVSEGEYDAPEALLPGERININTAPAVDLMRLPGIGEKKAKAIVEWREKYGPFRTTRQIMKVSGIGTGIFEGLEKYITV